MSLVTVAEARAMIDSSLIDANLQIAIDRVEARLAARIGPLTGARTETFFPDYLGERLYLRRSTATVTVTSDGIAVALGTDDGEYRLAKHGSALHRINNTWGAIVTAAYTPNDELRVEDVIIKLLRISLSDPTVVSERIGQYSYSKSQTPGAVEATEEALIRSLLPNFGLTSMRLTGSISRRPVPLEI